MSAIVIYPDTEPHYSDTRKSGLDKILQVLNTGPDIGETGAILASDGTASDTQSKLDSAVTGDTVRLPSSGSYTWTTDVILSASKGVKLDLNGRTVTFNNGAILVVHSTASGATVNRVTNGSIVRGTGGDPAQGTVQIIDTRTGAGVRVDHITFTGPTTLVNINGQGKGVLDNCTFPNLNWTQEFIHIWGWGAASETGWTMDDDSTLMGSELLFAIEDNTFTQPNTTNGVAWLQGFYGCRAVIRHNYFDWVSVDTHGTAGSIGARWLEAYDNIFMNDSNAVGQPAWAFSIRAGNVILTDNAMDAAANHAVSIGLCEEDSGYPALYQVGMGKLTGGTHAAGQSYVFNNGAGMNLSLNNCDASAAANMVQNPRDVSTSAPPGWSKFTYPHPLRNQ